MPPPPFSACSSAVHWPCMAQWAQPAPQEDFPAFFWRSRYTDDEDHNGKQYGTDEDRAQVC